MDPELTVHLIVGGKIGMFDSFFARTEFSRWASQLRSATARRSDHKRHGDLAGWQAIVEQLPKISPSECHLDRDTVTFGLPSDASGEKLKQLHDGLFALKPWRKGPYQLFDTFIDTEWRSDWKWQRVQPHIQPLNDHRIIDVGCGNGYHCWRMLGDGAKYVLGIDPSMRFVVQHSAIQKYAQDSRFDLLPLGIEDMPDNMGCFDSVFSMGVLYHRRNPINHLLELKSLMTPEGQLVLETLIVDDIEGGVLRPDDRYAMMRNVWSVMTPAHILSLLDQAGFANAVCVDQTVTTTDEQRRTEWMQFHSLAEFLDPSDQSKTIEGYPAPKRGLFIASLR